MQVAVCSLTSTKTRIECPNRISILLFHSYSRLKYPPTSLILVLSSSYPVALALHLSFSMGVTKKPSPGKSSLLVLAATVCSFAFVALLYTERISLLSSNQFRPAKSKKSTAGTFLYVYILSKLFCIILLQYISHANLRFGYQMIESWKAVVQLEMLQ